MTDEGRLDWPRGYPAEVLRAETRAMVDAWVEVIRGSLPEGAVRAIHFKGSALKRWDTRIDYVPELSDVDVHLALTSDRDEARLDDMTAAFEVNTRVLEAYRRRIPSALHLPKPQLVITNRLEQDPTVLPSPASTVETLLGEPYASASLSEEQRAISLQRGRETLLQARDFARALPMRIIDRPGQHIAQLLGEIGWRVSPTAPRVLELLGAPYEEAWTLNRTELVHALRERGQDVLAEAYQAYYLAGWRRFVEGWETGAALDVLRHGAEVLRLGADFAAKLE
jgi:hypothetical protein